MNIEQPYKNGMTGEKDSRNSRIIPILGHRDPKSSMSMENSILTSSPTFQGNPTIKENDESASGSPPRLA